MCLLADTMHGACFVSEEKKWQDFESFNVCFSFFANGLVDLLMNYLHKFARLILISAKINMHASR